MATTSGVSGDGKTVSQPQLRSGHLQPGDVRVNAPTALSLPETRLQSELVLGYQSPLSIVDLTGLRLPNNMGDAEVGAMRHRLEANRLASDNEAMKSFAAGARTSGQLGEVRKILEQIEIRRSEIVALSITKLSLEITKQNLEQQRSNSGSEEERSRLTGQIALLDATILHFDEDIRDKQAELENAENHKSRLLLLFAVADRKPESASGNESFVVDTEDEAVELAEFPALFPHLEQLYQRRLQDDGTREFILDKAQEQELSNLDDKAFMLAAIFAFTQDGLNSFDSLVASGPEQFAHLPENSGRHHLNI